MRHAILRLLASFAAIAAAMMAASAPAGAVAAPAYRVLHQFCKSSCSDGSFPAGDQLVLDASGKLTGTTSDGGRYNSGAIYQVFPKHDGAKYYKKVLKPFCYGSCAAGGNTQAGVIMDTAGNLYGTTPNGETGCGVVYEAVLSGGKYTLKVLHAFEPTGGDACSPTVGALAYHGREAGQLYDGTSPLFGVTLEGGANSRGAVYELDPPKPGRKAWREKVIYSYCQITGCGDGHDPSGNVVMDGAGNLYTAASEAAGSRVFELIPDGSGGYAAGPIYKSTTHELIVFLRITADGTLYGVADTGGPTNHGTLFKLAPAGGGGFDYTDLHDFCAGGGICVDGDLPDGLFVDPDGNIWGTTFGGGANPAPPGSPFSGAGTIFEYTSGGSFATLHNFCAEPDCADGGTPTSGLVTDGAGNFFGVASLGGEPLSTPKNGPMFAPLNRKAPLPPPPGGGGVLYEISLH